MLIHTNVCHQCILTHPGHEGQKGRQEVCIISCLPAWSGCQSCGMATLAGLNLVWQDGLSLGVVVDGDGLRDGLCWVRFTLAWAIACQLSWLDPRLKLTGLNIGLDGSFLRIGLGLAWTCCSGNGLNSGLVRICLSLGLALVRVRLAWPITIPLLPCSTGLTLGMLASSPPGLRFGLIRWFTGLGLGLATSQNLGLFNSAG